MKAYENINYVLANYFGPVAEYSEQEAISTLRRHLTEGAEFSEDLRTELQKALNDETYSWKDVFIENDVVFIETEEEARVYAKKILWDELFAA